LKRNACNKLKRILVIVVVREAISVVKARLKEYFTSTRSQSAGLDDIANLSSNFANYVNQPNPETHNLILLDDFPIYRWAVPNFILAHQIARETNAKIAVFFFREPTKSAKSLYRKFFVDELVVIHLSMTQKLELYREYRQLLKYLNHGESLINYKIQGIPIGLDIYESILRSGYPTIDIQSQKTFRIAYLGLKQFVFFRTFFKQKRIKSVLVSHDNYVGPGILAHMAFYYGVEVILANLISMTIPQRDFQSYEKFRRYKIYGEHLNKRELSGGIEWAKLQLSLRITGSLGVGIKYQKKSAFDGANVARQTSLNNVTKVLVLTHDFFDNPHGYARMFFDDFFAWMLFLASISLETSYEWYIKPHRDYSEKELEVLKSFISKNRKFHLVDPETSFYQLRSEGIDFALTCHGTVGHELPLLGYTVINASYNPHIAFNFNVSAKSKEDYEYILKHIADYKITEINYEEIYMFYYIHQMIVQDDKFLGISLDELDEISKDSLNSKEELEYLMNNVDVIGKNVIKHLNAMRASRRVYAFEGFLPTHVQLKRTHVSTVDEN
jgi:hypothetical protein